jgi:hypothetical protein
MLGLPWRGLESGGESPYLVWSTIVLAGTCQRDDDKPAAARAPSTYGHGAPLEQAAHCRVGPVL